MIGSAVALAGLASLPAAPAQAATIPVACNAPALVSAVQTANGTAASDTLTLASGCTYDLTSAASTSYGYTGLPAITNPLVITGNGATIERDFITNSNFRLIMVASGASLSLANLYLTNGFARGGDGGDSLPGRDDGGGGGGGAGLGGAIYNRGTLQLSGVTVGGNGAFGGAGGDGADENGSDEGGGGGGGGLGGAGGSLNTGDGDGGSGGGGFGGAGGAVLANADGGSGGGGTTGAGGDAVDDDLGGAGGVINGGEGGEYGDDTPAGANGGDGGGGGGGADEGNGGNGGVGGGGGGSGESDDDDIPLVGGSGGFGGGGGGGGEDASGGAGGFGGGGGGANDTDVEGDVTAGQGGFGAGDGGATQLDDVSTGGGGGAGIGGAIFNDGGTITLSCTILGSNVVVGGDGGAGGEAGFEGEAGTGVESGIYNHNGATSNDLGCDEYAAVVDADDPAGYWRFGEPSGTTMLDSSGTVPPNNGTYIGGVTLNQPGALVVNPNTAALYDGINDQGRVPDANSLDVGNSFTAEGWIKRSSDAKTHELMNKGASGIHLVVGNAASLNKVLLRRAGVATIADSTVGVPADGNYHHVVATMNGLGSTAKIYIDGVDRTHIVGAGQTILNTAFPLTFGSFGSAPATPAFYDEFALYDTALTQARITAHYNTGVD